MQWYEALWFFFHPKMSNAQDRWGLAQADGERYRLNDLRWIDFWLTEEEFDQACRSAVSDFAMARAWLGVL